MDTKALNPPLRNVEVIYSEMYLADLSVFSLSLSNAGFITPVCFQTLKNSHEFSY